jgi:transcriptional regulator with GAF, ATPase, and Fis domain
MEGAGDVLLLSMRGTGIRQLVDGNAEAYTLPGSQRLFRPIRLFRDRDGGLWIGTIDQGLLHVHQGRTDQFTRSDGLSGDFVQGIFEDRSIGRFERANRGTLFLDEIGDLPLDLQPKLLRVMQERQFERLGGTATIHTDVRVICATHRNLGDMIEERQFRADLFYRLSVFPIALPALRERPEDIPLLVRHFAMVYAQRMEKPIRAVSEEFIAALARHSWPGNVRELQNFVERSVILAKGAVLNGSLPEVTRMPEASVPVTLEEADRLHILQTLEQTGGVVGGPNGAAAQLGLPRTTLIAMMKRLGVSPLQKIIGGLSSHCLGGVSQAP